MWLALPPAWTLMIIPGLQSFCTLLGLWMLRHILIFGHPILRTIFKTCSYWIVVSVIHVYSKYAIILHTGANVYVPVYQFRQYKALTPHERHNNSNHPATRLLPCNLFRIITEKKKGPHYPPFVRGIYQWLVDSPNKALVMRKTFPCHAVLMIVYRQQGWF